MWTAMGEELYVLNTDTFGGDKRFGDHLFKKSTGGFTDVMELDVNTVTEHIRWSIRRVDRSGRWEVRHRGRELRPPPSAV